MRNVPRCHHPSGKGVHPYCQRRAVGSVRVKFYPNLPESRGWGAYLPACQEHFDSSEWYRSDITGEWLRVERYPLEKYVEQLNRLRERRDARL